MGDLGNVTPDPRPARCHQHEHADPPTRQYTRASAFLSGLLLLLFATVMTLALGFKATLNYSVLSAAAGALLLSAQDSFAWSLDSLLGRGRAGDPRSLGAARRPKGAAPAGGRA